MKTLYVMGRVPDGWSTTRAPDTEVVVVGNVGSGSRALLRTALRRTGGGCIELRENAHAGCIPCTPTNTTRDCCTTGRASSLLVTTMWQQPRGGGRRPWVDEQNRARSLLGARKSPATRQPDKAWSPPPVNTVSSAPVVLEQLQIYES